MFGRISNAAATAQANGVSSSSQGKSRGNGSDKSIASLALRRAGLMNDDTAMRTADASGPTRTGAYRKANRGHSGGRSSTGESSGSLISRIHDDEQSGSSSSTASSSKNSARKARDRANPLAGRPSRKPATISSADPSIKGMAFTIKGAAIAASQRPSGGQSRGKMMARIPGGDNAPTPTFNTQSTIKILTRLLASRWNGAAKFLNLENLGDDPILKDAKVAAPGQPGAHKDIGTVIFKLASEIYPELVTISLAKNNFKNLSPVTQLPQYLPDLQNLSLESNDLKWTKDLSTFASAGKPKLRNLRELILVGNPMQANAASAMNEEGYRAEIVAKFPTLRLLDRVEVSQKEVASAQLPSGKGKADHILGVGTPTRNFPLQTKAGFSDAAANGIVPGFLHKFFTLLDTARDSQELQAVYASNATWTIFLNRAITPRARSAGYINAQRDLNWNSYKQIVDHNIMRLSIQSASSRGVPVGPPSIVATIKKLPATRHPLTDASKFVVDSWILPNAAVGALAGTKDGRQPQKLEKPDAILFISVKGEFAEAPSYGVRSFDRTFVVAPSSADSAAAKAGWPCTILAEQLTVRNYSGIDGWKPDSLPVEVAAPSQASGGVPADHAQLPQVSSDTGNFGPQGATPVAPQPSKVEEVERHALALQFASETGLTYPFAVQCLQENGWQPQPAMHIFQSLKAAGTIPAEAFSAGTVALP